MREFSKQVKSVEPVSSTKVLSRCLGDAAEYPAYVGLDVHKDTIAVAVAEAGRGAPRFEGEIKNTPKAVAKLVARLCSHFGGQVLLWCYEAGPCGYVLHRQLVSLGQGCIVVAPSQIPTKPGDRVKTDRRDALKLARLLRAGELTAVWVPDAEQEAIRDLTRARTDFKKQEIAARQQLNAFLLRHGRSWPSGKTRWTKTHFRWLEEQRFEHPWQQLTFQEYVQAVKAATRRVDDMRQQIEQAVPQWSLAPVVYSLIALRGIDILAATVLLAELGDLSRFDSPRQLMGFLGLVPSEHTSAKSRRQGGITLTGNSHARRILVESAWCYRFPARLTGHLRRKATRASDEARDVAWNAQKRLCGRYQHLLAAGKNTKQTTVAVARELVGFIWDIACREMPKAAVAR